MAFVFSAESACQGLGFGAPLPRHFLPPLIQHVEATECQEAGTRGSQKFGMGTVLPLHV